MLPQRKKVLYGNNVVVLNILKLLRCCYFNNEVNQFDLGTLLCTKGMVWFLFTVPSAAPTFDVTVVNSTAVNVSWQVL